MALSEMANIILQQRLAHKRLAFIFGIVIFTCIFPISTLLFWLYAFRCVLKFYIRCFKPSLGKMLDMPCLAFSTTDPLDKQKPMDTVVISAVFTGAVTFGDVYRSVSRKIDEKNKDGSYKYHQFKQYPSSCFGYLFWKWDTKFLIDNHVSNGCMMYDAEIDDPNVNYVQAQLLREPFPKGRSPWEVFLIPDYVSNIQYSGFKPDRKSLVVIRFSNVLTDGYSLLRGILEDLEGREITHEVTSQQQSKVRKTILHRKIDDLRNAWYMLTSLVTLPFEILNLIWTFDENFIESHPKGWKPVQVRDCKLINISMIKQLKTKFKTSFQAILLAAYTAGVRRLLLHSQIDVPVPDSIHCLMPIPSGGHEDKFGNIMMYDFVRFPVGESCSWTRLQDINDQLKTQKRSRQPMQLYLMDKMFRLFPVSAYRFLAKTLVRQSGLITTVAATPPQLKNIHYGGDIERHRWLGGNVSVAYNRGNYWFGMNAVSFENHISIQTTHIDTGIFEGKENVLVNGIMEELEYLSRYRI